MEVTQEMLAPYMGGQIEVQNKQERYLYRGEISKITLADTNLVVKVAWLAKGEGYPPLPERWVRHTPKPYTVSLKIYIVDMIQGDRLTLHSPYTGELAVLFPKGGSCLDPAKVVGLKLKTKAPRKR